MDFFLQAVLLSDSTIRLAIPLILASLAGLFAERSGVVDIGLEGKMLGAAFAAASAAFVTGSALAGLCMGIVVSVCLSMIHGFACITHRGDQVVSGMALNIMVAGLGPTLAEAWFAQGGRTPGIGADARFRGHHLAVCRGPKGCADRGSALFGVDQWPQYPCLPHCRHRPLGRLDRLQDPLRACVCARSARTRAPSTRRASASPPCVTKRWCSPAVLLRHLRCLSFDCPRLLLHPRHDRGKRLPGAGSPDLR